MIRGIAPVRRGAITSRPSSSAAANGRSRFGLAARDPRLAGGRSLTKVIDDTTLELGFLARELGVTVP